MEAKSYGGSSDWSENPRILSTPDNPDETPLSVLKIETRQLNGNDQAWGGTEMSELGGHQNKRNTLYNSSPNGRHALTIPRHSRNYNLDQNFSRHHEVPEREDRKLMSPVSKTRISALPATADPIAPKQVAGTRISGEMKRWHKITITFEGPESCETSNPNPFLDYRLEVTFHHLETGKKYQIPGYFAADGDAANSGASCGNKWRVHFAPDEEGVWSWAASFETGKNIAVGGEDTDGKRHELIDRTSGALLISASDKTGRDLRGKGRLRYVGKHHLQFAGTGEYFLKAGPDAPENFLAYDGFDGTPNKLVGKRNNLRKSWAPHVGDFEAVEAREFTWKGDRGKEILGAINYLASKGLNAFSFLTFSLDGDDDNVFPHLMAVSESDWQNFAEDKRWGNHAVYHDRFDVSKLDQWEKVFEYATLKGFYLHFKTQETENDQLLDGGYTGIERKLYTRELIARFAHHLALNWNIGEENDTSTEQQRAAIKAFAQLDPYGHHRVLHTYPEEKEKVYPPLLGDNSDLTGLSLQGSKADFSDSFRDTLDWVEKSALAGKPWVVATDEPGDAKFALRPDSDPGHSHTDGRRDALWGTLLAGGAGCEFYFGYNFPESDLTLQDFRSRDRFWDYCRYALEFFAQNKIPFWEMTNVNRLVSDNGDNANRCLAKPGEIYVVQLRSGGTASLDLSQSAGTFNVSWYDPRNGGTLQNAGTVAAGRVVQLGEAPDSSNQDWVILVRQNP